MRRQAGGSWSARSASTPSTWTRAACCPTPSWPEASSYGNGSATRERPPSATDWTVIGENQAEGTLHGQPVTLTGVLGGGSVTDGTFPLYGSGAFSPPAARRRHGQHRGPGQTHVYHKVRRPGPGPGLAACLVRVGVHLPARNPGHEGQRGPDAHRDRQYRLRVRGRQHGLKRHAPAVRPVHLIECVVEGSLGLRSVHLRMISHSA